MIEKLGTDPWENTAESLPALNDTLWGPAYLSNMDYAYCPAYAINAIITEADVRIKKKWSRLGFFWLCGSGCLWSQSSKKHGFVSISKNTIRTISAGKIVKSIIVT